MTPAPAKRPRSQAQIEASRRNGAKSRGPKTAAGKAISCRNRACSPASDPIPAAADADFARILQTCNAEFQPANDLERSLTRQMALSQCRFYTLLSLETAMLNAEFNRTPKRGLTPTQRIAQAYRTLSMQSHRHNSLGAAIDRADALYFKTLHRLRRVQTLRRELEKEEISNPGAPAEPPVLYLQPTHKSCGSIVFNRSLPRCGIHQPSARARWPRAGPDLKVSRAPR